MELGRLRDHSWGFFSSFFKARAVFIPPATTFSEILTSASEIPLGGSQVLWDEFHHFCLFQDTHTFPRVYSSLASAPF